MIDKTYFTVLLSCILFVYSYCFTLLLYYLDNRVDSHVSCLWFCVEHYTLPSVENRCCFYHWSTCKFVYVDTEISADEPCESAVVVSRLQFNVEWEPRPASSDRRWSQDISW